MTTLVACGLGVSATAAILTAIAALIGTANSSHVPSTANRIPLTSVRRYTTVIGVALVAGAAVWWLSSWPVAAIAVVVALIVIFRKPRESSRPSTVDKLDALRSWTRRLVDVLSSGSGGLEQAITSSARTAPPVLATEIQSLDVRVRTRGLELALRGFADDLADSAADAVVMAVILRCRTGGRGLVDVLSAQATALSDTIAVRRDIDADRAKATTAIRIIAGVTIVVCAGLFLFSGAYLAPFDSFLGQLVLAAILALFAAAMWWMHSLIRPPQTGRILVTSGTTPRQREALSHTGTRP